ncbi:MAG: hypothetical protein GC136_02850 [Alphaproteobacteria bacterium]|nr:hypothetical protein [Alphaproteobacteria bacterium]
MTQKPYRTKTSSGKDALKVEVPFNIRAAKPVDVAGFEALKISDQHPFFYMPESQIPRQFTTLNAQDSYFGHLPRIWARATAFNRMVGETCVPLGRLPAEDLALMSQSPIGLNFMAKGPKWKHGHLQIPQEVAIFMNTLGYLQANLPDPRLWPAVEVVFKISSDLVKAGTTAQDPFAVQRKKGQGAGWHTDGDSDEESKILKENGGEIIRVENPHPQWNAHAFLKQRMIVDNFVPTYYSDSWHFSDVEKIEGQSLKFEGYPLLNGYPPREIIKPTFFPVGTPVSFTNNNMHSPRLAEADGQRMIIITSGTLNWSNLRRLQKIHPDLRWENFSTEAPQQILVPQRWSIV